MDKTLKTKAIFAAMKMLLPAILGAVGGVVATSFPGYFSAFCGV